MTDYRPGSEYSDEIAENYHERLATFWPHPREQLHIGGWAATHELARVLDIANCSHSLDLCCGEGGTANWLAQSHAIRVTGIDIVRQAIATARKAAVASDNPRFVVGNIFDLPFRANTFDIVYGQDPDGIAHHQRVYCFRECWRVLQPKGLFGFQHWLIHDDAPPSVVERFESINTDLGFASMRRLRVGDYTADLIEAGFEIVAVHDLHQMYAEHMHAMQEIARARGQQIDTWTRLVLELIDSGHKIGIRIIAKKP